LAAVVALSAGSAIATPAGATVIARCTWVKGTALFKPGLPQRGSTAKVKPAVTVKNGFVGDCSGGGVSKGTLALTLKAAIAGNCVSFRKGADMKLAGTGTIAWNTKTTSNLKVTAKPHPHPQLQLLELTGTVTGGKFAGRKLEVLLSFSSMLGGCQTGPLVFAGFKQRSPLTIES
jgi:hypothetical protein